MLWHMPWMVETTFVEASSSIVQCKKVNCVFRRIVVDVHYLEIYIYCKVLLVDLGTPVDNHYASIYNIMVMVVKISNERNIEYTMVTMEM